jgi:hypothetical protein
MDGTLIEAWAGRKSFQRKDRDDDPLNPPPSDRSSDPTINWHREKRSNETHESLTDPMARLYKKTRGAEAKQSNELAPQHSWQVCIRLMNRSPTWAPFKVR